MSPRASSLSLLGPALCGVVAILLSLAPVSLASPGLQGPHWLLMALYFWASRRHWTTPPALVFALGLPFDFLRDGPIGAELFALLAVIEATRWLADRQPPLTFLAEWARFVLAAAAFELLVVVLLAVTYAPTPDAWLVGSRLLAGALLYPLFAYILQRISGARIGEGRFTHLSF